MIYVGIDCGTHTGVCLWDSTSRKIVECYTTSLHLALFRVAEIADKERVKVVFEDARQRKWIPRERDIRQVVGRAIGAGHVQRDATVWEEFCTERSIPYEAVAPRQGLTKWTADYFNRVTGWQGRTSEHARDAAMLVFGR